MLVLSGPEGVGADSKCLWGLQFVGSDIRDTSSLVCELKAVGLSSKSCSEDALSDVINDAGGKSSPSIRGKLRFANLPPHVQHLSGVGMVLAEQVDIRFGIPGSQVLWVSCLSSTWSLSRLLQSNLPS